VQRAMLTSRQPTLLTVVNNVQMSKDDPMVAATEEGILCKYLVHETVGSG
jgi:hypothetical protein